MKYVGMTARGENVNNKWSSYVSHSYINALKDVGLIPLILPLDDNIDPLLDLCSCFLITGGDDINPLFYNEENIHCSKICDLEDELDFTVLKHATETNKPVLGICKGMQSINVFFNGSLYQNITNHQNSTHLVCKDQETFLSKYLDKSFQTNSYHHQSIKLLGDNLKIAYQSNGVIESIVSTNYPIFGIGWHPEKEHTKNNDQIFKCFRDLIV